MKKVLFILTFFACTQWSYGQWVHFLLRNRDRQTRNQMGSTVKAATARVGVTSYANTDLKNATKHLDSMIDRYYTLSKYDTKSTEYVKKAFVGYAYQKAADILTDEDYKQMYMTDNKRAYIDNIGEDRANVIASILSTSLASNTVKSDNRQEMYRLKDELLRIFAKNNRDLRQIMGVTILGGLIKSGLTDDEDQVSKALQFFNWSNNVDVFDFSKDTYSEEEQENKSLVNE